MWNLGLFSPLFFFFLVFILLVIQSKCWIELPSFGLGFCCAPGVLVCLLCPGILQAAVSCWNINTVAEQLCNNWHAENTKAFSVCVRILELLLQ